MHYSPDDEKIAKIPLVWITAAPTATMHGSCSYAVEVGKWTTEGVLCLDPD